MTAKKVFEQQARSDPLYALGLGSMVFLKAIMVGLIIVIVYINSTLIAIIDKCDRHQVTKQRKMHLKYFYLHTP